MASTGIASRTQLPPSPEIRGAAASDLVDLIPLDFKSPSSRLRSIAKYESFHPQALACSPPVPASYVETEQKPKKLSETVGANRPSGKQQQQGAAAITSLGAIAGSHGVALFTVSRPHVPLLILSHASTSETKGAGLRSLSFQPDCSRSMYLAAARGSGVLVWDVSGHSLSPLCGRLEVENGTDFNSKITSLAWHPSGDGAPLLAATTASSACLWDLRESAGSSFFKPSLRFGIARKASTGLIHSAPYIQVACSNRDECAILDASGILRVFDTRMTDRTRMSMGALSSFSAFGQAGIGLQNIPTKLDESRWLTWGLDTPSGDAFVKIWASTDDTVESLTTAGEDHLLMDGSPEQCLEKTASSTPAGYRLAGHCAVPNLACARVCPSPVEDCLLTVGVNNEELDGQSSWRADLWKLTENADDPSGLDRVVSFKASVDTDKCISSMLGKSVSLGRLRASELAISSFSGFIEGRSSVAESLKGKTSSDPEEGLMLCSLTENGYVTTHAIPEAIPEDKLESSRSHFSPMFGAVVSPLTRVFPDENNLAVKDAARVWGKQGEGATAAVESRLVNEKQDIISGQAVDGVSMPFDMDVPVAYSIAAGTVAGTQTGGITDMISPASVSPTLAVAVESDQIVSGGRDTSPRLNIEADRIPCPRLCGAVFGPGVGGLSFFNNGDVRKMWSWYSRNDSAQLSSVPGLIGEPSTQVASEHPARDNLTGGSEVPTPRACPRTLQDLMDMTSTAKKAQWGDAQDESDMSSAGFPAIGDNFFEEDSDGSSESADDGSDPLAGASDEKGSHGTYDEGLDKSLQLLKKPNADEEELHGHEQHDVKKERADLVGPLSDMLSPVVQVSYSLDRLALNNQNIFLAKCWKMFLWESQYCTDIADDVPRSPAIGDLSERSYGLVEGSAHANAESTPLSQKHALPRYRFLVPSPPSSKPITTVQSDPMFKKTSGPSPPPLRMTELADDERGVHGGEYSVRPNMQESMIFLRKLFTHQQEGGKQVPSLFSPPDSPMLPNSLTRATRQLDDADSPTQATSTSGKLSKTESACMQLGVHTLRAEDSSSNPCRDQELLDIKGICLHNALASRELGETEKGEVWELLSQVVDSRLTEFGNPFDGWGGFSGGALGASLVGNMLQYYESLGDVQMLSTIVCVLRGGRSLGHKGGPRWSLLPANQDEKYDTYIRRYADLLYGWGLLSIRAELMKHLVRVVPNQESADSLIEEVSDEGRTSGIVIVFTCSRCGKEADLGTNFCRSCQDYAFRCVICDNAVRGLFTVCESCGHGGHVGHIKTWFANHNECPSGCGCNCIDASSAMQSLAELQAPLPADGPGILPSTQEV